MADINFNDDQDRKKPNKRDPVMLLLIVIGLITVITVAIIGLGKASELSELENELARMERFLQSPDTLAQVQEYNDTQDKIAELQRTRVPLRVAYKFCRRMHTATSSLLNEAMWEPMREMGGYVAFAGLLVSGLNVTMEVAVDDLDTQRRYQLALEDKTVLVDSYGGDKIPGAPRGEGDQEVSRFRNQFTYEYTIRDDVELPFDALVGEEDREIHREFRQIDQLDDEHYGHLYAVLYRARLNKAVPDAVFNVFGGEW